jgi:hypothetical protein
MKADAKTEAAVMNVLKQYIEAYAKRDLDAFLALFCVLDMQQKSVLFHL